MSSSKYKNTDAERFKNSVKPFFYPSDKCYITYSQSNKLSNEAELLALTPQQVKEKFGFELLCDDLEKSTKEKHDCFEYAIKQVFSSSLKGVPSYSIKANTLDSFVLHQTSTKTGFGISAATTLERGAIIAEYVGERKFSFGGDSTYLVLTNHGKKDIDAKDYGNVARFFNHCPSKHPNKQVLTANVQPIGCSDAGETKLFFVALRDIKPFEPICWDYLEFYDFGSGIELLNAKTYLPMVGSTEFTGEL